MIVSFVPEDHKNGLDGAKTEGCGCCSNSWNITGEKERIIKEAQENIHIVKRICKYYGIDFMKFIKEVKS
jgi:hypothetical protein